MMMMPSLFAGTNDLYLYLTLYQSLDYVSLGSGLDVQRRELLAEARHHLLHERLHRGDVDNLEPVQVDGPVVLDVPSRLALRG